ncbi:MAG: ribosome biogenesis GTPase Der [Parachlamydiaceae bacterium]|nr:ribosome biogenesis GTPase Der [Parachlamydiaceae bacterium]
MSKLKKLAIVGRPNVGKSALFNRICKRKIAIVDEAEGVTRDRLYSEADLFGYPFQVIDTGGINARSPALFNNEIKRQAEIAIEEADALVMVVDGVVGLTDLDQDLAHILLRTKKPLCLAVNKIDSYAKEDEIYLFQKLGIKRMVAVSAAQSWHIAELLETALQDFQKEGVTAPESLETKVAIVGRPNVGKSSLVNYLLDDNRCIVSPIPGTTRDSVDISFSQGEDLYTLIDTAGIRRKHSEHEVVDKFAAIRTERAIERADVCILMLDASSGITTQEKKIANMIEEAGKGCILLFNKWDLVKGFRMEHCLKGIEEEVSFLKHCPKVFISALTGRNVEKIFPIVKKVHEDSKVRITTHQLNKFVAAAMHRNHPPMVSGKRLRIYYMAQVDVQPPKFVLFVNYPELMTEPYRKYLYNQFREAYGFLGVPITLHMKGKKRTKEERLGHVKVKAIGEAGHEHHEHPEVEVLKKLDPSFDTDSFDASIFEDFEDHED